MAWSDSAWLYRLPITLDNTANVASALSYYQAAVSLTGPAYASFRAHAKADGSDLRVMDSDGVTPLSFALEGIDTANSAVHLLIKVPYCAAGATRAVYVYYGNPAATSVSSYATTVGPTTAIVGPTDEYTQSDMANFNADPVAVLLRNQGGIHGGGASLNGKILCFLMAGSVSNGDRTNSGIAMMSSTDSGLTWGGKTTLIAHDSTHCAEPRSAVELADGTILLVYSTDTFATSSSGKAQAYIGKSTDGGLTWTNLAISGTAANPIAVPWTYGTDGGGPYGRMIEKTAGGDLFLSAYGRISTDTGTHSWLLKCPSGSDPTNGSNWVVQGTIAFNNVDLYQEPSVAQTTDSNHLLAIMRNGASGASGDLYSCVSADSGATWTAPARLNLPGVFYQALGAAVSPELVKLASGNFLLCWGVRYGSDYGAVAAAISTDGGATWLDRVPFITTTGNNSSLWDGGYPTAVQNADGTICVLAYRNLGALATCNVFRMILTEDYVANCNNVYEPCESFDALFSAHGANATIDATHVHNGSNAVKIDNSAATGGINDYVVISAWSTNTAKQIARIAYSYWGYETANDSAWASRVSASAMLGVGNRANEAVFGSNNQHLEWFNGTAYQDTGTVVPANRWNKHTLKADVEPSSVTGQLLINNVSATTGLGQYGAGGPPLTIQVQGASVAATHNVIFWMDDLYTHQYTANTPSATAGTEQGNTATSYALTPPSPSSGYVNNLSGAFTITPNGAFTGTITITPSGGGLSTPVVLTFFNSSAAQTFTLTPTATGTVTLAATNSGGFTDPAPITYTVASQTLAVAPSVLYAAVPTTVTLTGGGTRWTTLPPVFSLSGSAAAGSTIGSVLVLGDTSATALITPGTTTGSLTIVDVSSGVNVTTIVSVAALTSPYVAHTGRFAHGLLGSVGYTVLHGTGAPYAARSTNDVFTVGLTGYAALISIPVSGNYLILWDDGAGNEDFEVINPPAVESPSAGVPGGLNQSQALADIHAVTCGKMSTGSEVFFAPDGTTARVSRVGVAPGRDSTINPPT